MSQAVKPYLIAAADSVTFDGWWLDAAGDWTPLPDTLSDWDYNTDIHLRGEVRVDRRMLLASTGLLEQSDIRLALSWRSVDGRIGGTAFVRGLDASDHDAIDVRLPGDALGPAIDLGLRIVLGDEVELAGPGVARLAGSVLWEHVSRITLVGQAARFPAVVVDFSTCGLDVDASWVLELPDDLDSPVLGGLLLLLNARDTELVSTINGSGRRSDASTRMLQEQVAVQLLDHAVAHADALAAEDWDEGSLASTLVMLGGRVEGGLTRLAGLRESNPTAYRAALVGEARRQSARGADE